MKRTEIGAINNFDVLCAAESPGTLWLSLKDSAERGLIEKGEALLKVSF